MYLKKEYLKKRIQDNTLTMYNIDYECRYYKDDVFLDTDDVTDEEKDFIRTILYREDLLSLFYIEDDLDNFEIISSLYTHLADSSELVECMKMASSNIMSLDNTHGLCVLFSYDYMYLTHKCVCSYLSTGKVDTDALRLLKDKLQ